MSITQDDLSERVRLRLNAIPEWGPQGGEKRFGGQLLTFVAGYLLTLSSDKRYASLGMALCKGSATSFGELLGLKINRWMQGR